MQNTRARSTRECAPVRHGSINASIESGGGLRAVLRCQVPRRGLSSNEQMARKSNRKRGEVGRE